MPTTALRRLFGIAALASAALAVQATPASAAYTDCLSGRACVWTGYSYPGAPSASFTSSVQLSGSSNQVSSIVNNGNTNIARYYDGGSFNGDSIALNNPARGGQWRDPDLRNGIDLDTDPFDKKISSAAFV
jgi:hypothetical protein